MGHFVLKHRLCAVVIVRHGIAVQSFEYSFFLPLGRPEISVRYLDDWGVDEIILLDTTASLERGGPNFTLLKTVASHCHTPLTFGGGVKSVEQACQAVHSGADKVSINSAALSNPVLVKELVSEIGAQSCVVSVDAVRNGDYFVAWDPESRKPTDIKIEDHIRTCEQFGAGEFIVASVERDGSASGFNLQMAESLETIASVPILIAGGGDSPLHVEDLLRVKRIRGAVIGNRWMHTEHSVTAFKNGLVGRVSLRQDSTFCYPPNIVDLGGRLLSRDEEALEEMLFIKIEDEEV